jgi:cytochrome c biogenesis protein CcdA
LLQLVGLVVSVALADSLNPSTVGPALYLAIGPSPVRRVLAFTAGVFAILLAGGLFVALGPGELLLSLVPRPGPTTRHVAEVLSGVAMVVTSIVLWVKRRTLAARPLPGKNLSGGSSFLLGIVISIIEFPTALPYFAVIAVVVGSGVSMLERVELVTLFCIVFCAPKLAIVALLVAAGERAQRPLERAGDFMEAHWPELLAWLLVATGLGLLVVGGLGLVRA